MKKTSMLTGLAVLILACGSCQQKKSTENQNVLVQIVDTNEVNDTTFYGKCGENTTMHMLELLADDGKTYQLMVNMDDSVTTVQGGLLSGDRLAVIAGVEYGDTVATRVINLTTLQGRWNSIDRDFEIREGGLIESNLEAETNPWTSWRIYNGQLLLNTDTFDIVELGADSLFLENKDGIFGYKRSKVAVADHQK